MKKILLTSLFACIAFFIHPLHAQQCSPGTIACIDTLASNVAIISNNGTYNFGDTCILVCSGTTMNLVNGPLGHGLNNVYVEGNATINISSSINGVMAKAGSTVNLLSGSTATQVICEPGVTVTQNGLPWSGNCTCNEVIFDYTYAPAAAHCISTEIEQMPSLVSLQIFPNPAKDFVTIELNGFSKNDEIALYNALGIKLSSHPYSGRRLTLNTSFLSPGIYFLTGKKLETNLLIKKLVISE